MSCCHHCRDAENLFDRRDARRRLVRYQRRGPEGTTRLLVDALRAAGVVGATILDIGGGAGVIHHELLRAGAARATDIDASSAYLAAARAESERHGYAERESPTSTAILWLSPTPWPPPILSRSTGLSAATRIWRRWLRRQPPTPGGSSASSTHVTSGGCGQEYEWVIWDWQSNARPSASSATRLPLWMRRSGRRDSPSGSSRIAACGRWFSTHGINVRIADSR